MMPAAEITAALISAAAAAATSAADALREGLKQSGTRAGLIINAGPHELKEIAAQIVWGSWVSPPSNQAVGEPSPEVLFTAWKESGEVPAGILPEIEKMKSYKEMTASQSFLFIAWAETVLKQSAGEPATFSAIGSGGGVEALVVYQVADDETDPNKPTVAAFYIVGGGSWYSTYGGCALISRTQYNDFHAADSTLRNLMSKIYDAIYNQDNPTPGYDCSSGETRIVTLGKWICSMNGGYLSEFSLSYDYSGKSQNWGERSAIRIPRENQPPHPKHRLPIPPAGSRFVS
jgi:hypothetical protein